MFVLAGWVLWRLQEEGGREGGLPASGAALEGVCVAFLGVVFCAAVGSRGVACVDFPVRSRRLQHEGVFLADGRVQVCGRGLVRATWRLCATIVGLLSFVL